MMTPPLSICAKPAFVVHVDFSMAMKVAPSVYEKENQNYGFTYCTTGAYAPQKKIRRIGDSRHPMRRIALGQISDRSC
jgi:hypothetical protein